ncbi:hypothetical protein M409DRAFT_68962 [Zasmidium cellare ATCC 36951]|uniref:Heterokaryon incompatibility domain-containing protein n=1 Tax=Zasmidium cellare ATCC 36951 TaxID=1080233 RepID=A0A6A6C6L1_ZASCE|nr:uncharacterized protein M409DRAFT_68962 [Zasmidium cellare ATCC 36951]KAF2162665.1 hypothetical protein M409DRAFT_68962 [Zasmidium cellare ATCC 36951]
MSANGVNGHREDVLYRKLSADRKEIRILCLEEDRDPNTPHYGNDPATTPPTPSKLNFRWEYISLSDRIVPHYDAISYSWGNDEEKAKGATIDLNGETITIPKNAQQALNALCLRHGHYRVWIDAVCIDQEDKTERNVQVSFMGDIFSKATRVCVWLGEDHSSGEPAIGSIRTLLQSLDPRLPEALKSPHSLSNQSPPLSTDPGKLSSYLGWPSVYSFYSNRWFTRAWVIQEVCLAKQAIFYQGKYPSAVDFNEIAVLATYLYERRYTLPKNPKKSALTGFENAATMYTLKRHKSQKLASLLRVVYTFHCSEPHDMVYSVLGMRHRSAQKAESVHRVIPIYEEPIVEVYAKATKAAITETRSLGILKHAHSLRPLHRRSGEFDDFPSWALRMDLRGHYHINPISYRNFRFNANNYLPLVLWPNESSRVLRVQGVLVDVICDVSECMRWKQYGAENLVNGGGNGFNDTLTAAAVLHETYNWTKEQLPLWKGKDLAAKFSMTIAAGQDASGRNLAEDRANANRLHHGFWTTAHYPECPNSAGATNGDVSESEDDAASVTSASTNSRSIDVKDFDADLEADNPDATYALAAMMKGGHHRTVYVTERGALGLGTDNVEPGDCLVILFGGSVPFVLRPEKHYWRFVGDTYVEEVMHGEFIKSLNEVNRLEGAKQWFKIR